MQKWNKRNKNQDKIKVICFEQMYGRHKQMSYKVKSSKTGKRRIEERNSKPQISK